MHQLQQIENFPYLQHIASSINESKLTSELLAFVKEETSQQGKQADNQSCCKHSGKKGEYFQTQYPWVKFCQTCALNLALCGKRIQKSLSSGQMFTKIVLCDTLQSINHAILKSQNSHNQLSYLSSQLETCRQHFMSLVCDIDKFISSLSQIKNQLQQNIQMYFTSQIKQILERQSLIVSKKIELINRKTKIQCGFLDIIAEGNQQQKTRNMMAQCKQIIGSAFQLLLNENYKIGIVQNVKKVQKVFSQKIQQIYKARLTLQDQQFSQNLSRQISSISYKFSQKILKQINNTLSDESKIQQCEVKGVTSCSATLQNSGLTTPSQNNQGPLQQLSQTKRNSRATFQLKVRCRSKSGQRKIEVNVRQQRQKRIKVNSFA